MSDTVTNPTTDIPQEPARGVTQPTLDPSLDPEPAEEMIETSTRISDVPTDLIERPWTFQLVRDEDRIHGSIPELPGCYAEGFTYTQALDRLHDALRDWLAAALRTGTPIPHPGFTEGIRESRKMCTCGMFRAHELTEHDERVARASIAAWKEYRRDEYAAKADALSESVRHHHGNRKSTPQDVIDTATQFESFLGSGVVPNITVNIVADPE